MNSPQYYHPSFKTSLRVSAELRNRNLPHFAGEVNTINTEQKWISFKDGEEIRLRIINNSLRHGGRLLPTLEELSNFYFPVSSVASP